MGRALIAPLKERWVRLAEATVTGLERTSEAALQAVMADLARSLSSAGGRQRLARREQRDRDATEPKSAERTR